MDDTTIGGYRVTGLIGRGGMGVVYAAEHALLGRPAAIKVLLPDLSQKQDVVLRFFNEARAATAIRHPGIIEIYDFGWTPDGAAFIVMERLEGETLARRSARLRQRWPAVLAVARQIAGALAAAHTKGIVHRDLKPDNVFLVPDPEVPGGERIKLLDFGIAKLAVDSSPASVTKTGAVMGTPTYMAPEQCRGVAVDHRADLYSLGCVIYELCCGRPPFVGEGSGDVLAAHIHLPVPAMTPHNAEIPAAVEQLVRRLLAKVPAERLQSAEEVIRAIDALSTERPPSAVGTRRAATASSVPSVTTLSGSASTSMRIPRAGRRRWPIAVFSVGLAAITVLIVTLVMRRGGDAPVIASHPTEPAGSAAPPATAPPAPITPSPVSPSPGSSAAALPTEPAPAPVAPHDESPPPPAPAAPHDEPAPLAPATPSADAPHGPTTPDAPRTAPHPRPLPAQREPARRAADSSDVIDVAIDSTPRGTQIVLDGKMIGTTPYHGTLPRRDREIKLVLHLDGYADRIVVARESQSINERVTLARKVAPPPVKNAKSDRDRSVNPF